MAGKMQQYLRTEYLQPPPGPPTLDAKNSPLALLAQTCSSIGKEPHSVRKPLLQSKLLYSPKDGNKSPTENPIKSNSAGSAYSVHRASPTAPMKRSSPHRSLKRETPPCDDCSSPAKKQRSSPDHARGREAARSHSDTVPPPLEHIKHNSLDIKRRSTVSLDEADSKNIKFEQAAARHKPLSGASPNASRICPSSSAAAESSLSQTTSPQQHLMSLYDPYCVGCQGSHVAGAPCLDGMKIPPLSLYSFGNPSTAYPIYAHMLMAARNASAVAAAAEASPHVCNWVNAETGSCGKRFATGEELFNHLRTHAIAAPSTNSTNYFLNGLEKMATSPYAAYLSQQALAAISPTASNPVSSNFLSRSHSPLSRFHSYKTSNMLSQLSGLPSLPIAAGMGPYCSPYSVYGQRLGAAASGFSYP